MTFFCGQLARATLGFSLIVFAAGSIDARAQEIGAAAATGGGCPNDGAAFADPLNKPHWNGWGVDPSQHRFQPADMARLAPADVARLKLKWAFGFRGAVRSVAQPTIFGGRVFVGSQNGKVYSLDAKSGCTYWQFEAGKPVRSAVVIGPRGDGWAAYFGDAGANVYAIDALTGKPLWTTKVDQHPAAIVTGAPTLVGTTLFVPVSSYEEAKAKDAVLRLLHVPGQRRRFGRRIGKDPVEDIHDRARSQAWPGQRGWFSADGAFGGPDLVRADL